MNPPGAPNDLLVRSRSALLDALDALDAQRDAIIVIGAQAVYVRTSAAPVALAEATKDTDLALDPRALAPAPRIEEAMARAGFIVMGQPGSWVNADGIPVDLMVPSTLAGPGNRQTRGARLPPHDRTSMRRANGLEATLVDNDAMDVHALDIRDSRRHHVRVAGPAALIVAKTFKIAERADAPQRLNDKDAHDIYRILVGTDTAELAARFQRLRTDQVSSGTTLEAQEHLRTLFGGPDALGSAMAGRAEEGIGEPATVSLATATLTSDLLDAITRL
jgi:hypothetical protein